jgi:predicted phosphoribosyltransferase
MKVTSITSVAAYSGATKKLFELTNAKLYNLTTSTTTGNTTTVTPKAGVTLESSAAAARRAGVTITFVTKLVVPKAEEAAFKAASPLVI